jgi:phenylpropionate dioxygenase-like ring-hydroxylating dioxygenase large terminal subunit
VPPGARVFSYPCAETLGVIWAFNGAAPTFAPPAVRDFAPEALLVRARKAHVFTVAPWISVGNTFDFLHLRHVHGLDFEFDPKQSGRSSATTARWRSSCAGSPPSRPPPPRRSSTERNRAGLSAG